jgi:hypothetical protein
MKNNRMEQMFKVGDLAKRLIRRGQDLVQPTLTPEERKGIDNEKRAFCLIDAILGEQELFALSSRPYISSTYSTEDLDGFDIVIPTDKGKTGIQIKSSGEEAGLFTVAKPHIPVVVVNCYKSDTRLKIELASALRYAYEQLLKGRVKIK